MFCSDSASEPKNSINSYAISSPTIDPHVPGPKGMKPEPRPVAIRTANQSARPLTLSLCPRLSRLSLNLRSSIGLLNHLRNQVVFVRLADLDLDEGARPSRKSLRRVVDQYVPVNLRRLRFQTSLQQQIALLRNAFEQGSEPLSDESLVATF